MWEGLIVKVIHIMPISQAIYQFSVFIGAPKLDRDHSGFPLLTMMYFVSPRLGKRGQPHTVNKIKKALNCRPDTSKRYFYNTTPGKVLSMDVVPDQFQKALDCNIIYDTIAT